MKQYEIAKIISNFTQQTNSQSILFFSQASYTTHNTQTFRDIMFYFLKKKYCTNSGEEKCDCLNCQLIKNLNHPDIKIITPIATGNNDPKVFIDFLLDSNSSKVNFSERKLAINKDQILEVQNFVFNSLPSISKDKTIIFWLPEYMNTIAMNLLLKTVEEPPKNTYFLFFTENRDILLPTLLSRTTQFFIHNNEKQIDNFEENMQLFVEWMRMCYAKKYVKIIEFIDDFAKREKEFQKNFFLFLGFICEQLWLSSLQLYRLMNLLDKNFETINKMANTFSTESIIKIYELVNKYFQYFNRNSNVKLLLMNLAIEINKMKK